MSKQEISTKFPFESKFIEVYNSKIHYIEEGSGDPILFLHGNPSSSYIWRNIIPYMTSKGLCIAPDLIGMGKSDKPDLKYSFFDHVKYVEGFIEKKNLRNITLVIHDWGSALGFHYAMRNEKNIKGIAFMEGIIKPLTWDLLSEGVAKYFKLVRNPELGKELIINQNILIERILPTTMIRVLTEEEYNFYSSPFKDPASRKPLLRFPNEVPIEGEPEDVSAAVQSYKEKLKESNLPKLMFHANPGSIVTPELIEWCKKNLPNLTTVDIGPGTHFLQEDNPHLIGEEIAKWYDGILPEEA